MSLAVNLGDGQGPLCFQKTAPGVGGRTPGCEVGSCTAEIAAVPSWEGELHRTTPARLQRLVTAAAGTPAARLRLARSSPAAC